MARTPQSFLGLAAGIWLALFSAEARPEEVTIFAAASTTDALNAVIQAYESEENHKVRAVFAASSTLAKQILQGAPADLFLSASTDWMDYLEKHAGIEANTRKPLLANRLVLIAAAGADLQVDLKRTGSLAEAIEGGRLALGDPAHVPAGIYGKSALSSLGIWTGIRQKTARAASVRAALALVERGEAAAGIVYRSDAWNRKSVRTLAVFPEDSHPPISYPLARVKNRDSASIRGFAAFLAGGAALEIFERHGFAVSKGR